mmetsp:Transcript_2905/g.8906  ORF Transcript_2905/g.8906 Transcript_2905/m.8906 type:complete len:202 (-) Transcript_2905:166-771(-)
MIVPLLARPLDLLSHGCCFVRSGRSTYASASSARRPRSSPSGSAALSTATTLIPLWARWCPSHTRRCLHIRATKLRSVRWLVVSAVAFRWSWQAKTRPGGCPPNWNFLGTQPRSEASKVLSSGAGSMTWPCRRYCCGLVWASRRRSTCARILSEGSCAPRLPVSQRRGSEDRAGDGIIREGGSACTKPLVVCKGHEKDLRE